MNDPRWQLTARDLMTADPIVVRASTPVHEIAEVLDQYGVTGVPVVDGDGRLAGVVSHTDLVRARAEKALFDRWPDLTAGDLMTSPAFSCQLSSTIDEVAGIMDAFHVHRLVVVDDEGDAPIGVVSTTDLIHALAEEAGL